MPAQFRITGDEGVGLFEPTDVRPADFTRLPSDLLATLRRLPGLVATVSDALDELGWSLAVPSSRLQPRHLDQAAAVGHAVTLRYLPSRRHLLHEGYTDSPPELAHHTVLRSAVNGDFMLIDASAVDGYVSVMGGIVAQTCVTQGLAGVVVDGGVRDLDQIRATGLKLWTRHVTPSCGKYRLEGVTVNGPISCGGVQVIPGDLVVADATGICFVPGDVVHDVIRRVLEVSDGEKALLNTPSDRHA